MILNRDKILNRTKASDLYKQKHTHQMKIAFVTGHFVSLHPGHERIMQYASSISDIVVINFIPSKELSLGSSDYQNQLVKLLNMSTADYVYEGQGDTLEILNILKPDFVIKGQEFISLPNKEQDLISSYGGRLIFYHDSIVENKNTNPALGAIKHHNAYLKENKILKEDLILALKVIKNQKILVIGEPIIDIFQHCTPVGMSQEEPCIVFQPRHENVYVGGAGIVAAHCAGLGCETSLITIVGKGPENSLIQETCEALNVRLSLIKDPEFDVVTKRRYLFEDKSLFRVNKTPLVPIDGPHHTEFTCQVSESLKDCDVMIIAAFSYGLMTQPVVDAIIREANKNGVFVAADAQTSSQRGDLSKYKGISLLTPSEHEARSALAGERYSLEHTLNQILQKLNPANLAITLDKNGVMFKDSSGKVQYIRALNVSPQNVSGAGDSFLVMLSVALSSGVDIKVAGYLASIMAALQVAQEGNLPLNRDQIHEVIEQM